MAQPRKKVRARPRKGDVAMDKAVYDAIRRAMLMGRTALYSYSRLATVVGEREHRRQHDDDHSRAGGGDQPPHDAHR